MIARLFVRDEGGDLRRTPGAHPRVAAPRHRRGRPCRGRGGGLPDGLRAVRPGQPAAPSTQRGRRDAGRTRWITVRTEDDRTVTPSVSAKLDGALNIDVQDICAGATTSHGDQHIKAATKSMSQVSRVLPALRELQHVPFNGRSRCEDFVGQHLPTASNCADRRNREHDDLHSVARDSGRHPTLRLGGSCGDAGRVHRHRGWRWSRDRGRNNHHTTFRPRNASLSEDRLAGRGEPSPTRASLCARFIPRRYGME